MTVKEEKLIDSVSEVITDLEERAKFLNDRQAPHFSAEVIKEVFLGTAKKLKKALREFCDRAGDYNFDDDSEYKNRLELMEDKGVMERDSITRGAN